MDENEKKPGVPSSEPGKQSGDKSSGGRDSKSSNDKGKRSHSKNRNRNKNGKSGEGSPSGKGCKPWNDAQDFLRDKVKAELTFKVPFGLPVGLPQALTSGTINVPAIMVTRMLVTMGAATGPSSPINQVGRDRWMFNRSKMSTARSYDNNDISLYFGTLGQCYAFSGWVDRLCEITKSASALNRTLPVTLLRSIDVDADDVISQQARLAYLSAWFKSQFNRFALPGDIKYFKYCYRAFRFVNIDDDSPKAQIYLNHFSALGFYDPIHDEEGGALVYKNLDTIFEELEADYITVDVIEKIMKKLLDAATDDEGFLQISADFMRAYEDTDTQKVFMYNATEAYPTYIKDLEQLAQIHNAVAMPLNWGVENNFVYESVVPGEGSLPYLRLRKNANGIGPIVLADMRDTKAPKAWIDAFSASPTVDQLVLLPRFKATFELDPESDTPRLQLSGFEMYYIERFTVYVYNSNNHSVDSHDYRTYIVASNPSQLHSLFPITQFDWHPILFACFRDGSVLSGWHIVGDCYNLRVIDNGLMQQMFESDLFSVFSFPKDLSTALK